MYIWHNLPACSFFFTLVLALQPFATPSSASLLIPLQTVLLRTPTDAALRWASELYFFNMLASMFLAFSKLCLSSFHAFFRPFPAFSYGFSRVSFLHFPHFPNGFLNFPWFFQACHSFFPPFYLFFSTIFLHFPPGSNDFPSFSLFFHTFFLPFSGDLGRIEPQPHQIA